MDVKVATIVDRHALDLLVQREKRSRLARELAKLDPAEEKKLADEGLGESSRPLPASRSRRASL